MAPGPHLPGCGAEAEACLGSPHLALRAALFISPHSPSIFRTSLSPPESFCQSSLRKRRRGFGKGVSGKVWEIWREDPGDKSRFLVWERTTRRKRWCESGGPGERAGQDREGRPLRKESRPRRSWWLWGLNPFWNNAQCKQTNVDGGGGEGDGDGDDGNDGDVDGMVGWGWWWW